MSHVSRQRRAREGVPARAAAVHWLQWCQSKLVTVCEWQSPDSHITLIMSDAGLSTTGKAMCKLAAVLRRCMCTVRTGRRQDIKTGTYCCEGVLEAS